MSQAEGVIKNIIRQIAQECAAHGNVVTDTLVAFVVKAVVLDPQNEFNVDRMLTKEDVRKLVQLCVEKLMKKCSPALDTIKMQVYFDMNYTSRSEFMEEHHGVLRSRLSPVMRDITDSRVKTREELDALYKAIIHYMLLSSGLGSPSDLNTVRETTAALQSVFPQVELGTFMSLLKRDKEQQLTELTMIVTGIRLFNKYSKKGGEAIDNLPKILREALPAARNVIEHELVLSQSLAWKYTAVLERLIGTEENQQLLVQLKQALYNVRQHQAFLKVILADVCLCGEHVERLQGELVSRIQQLKDTVHTKTAVPTAQVFPHFRAVATLWRSLQDEMVVLSILDGMVTHLQPFLSSQAQLFSPGRLDGLLQGSDVKTDEGRMAESSGDRIDPSEMKTHEWLLPETTANLDKLPLQYKGYCGYALVKKGGLLLPGNPSIGVLKHRDKFYVFSSKQAALNFASRADEMIESVGERAKRSPELIHLLQLHQQFSTVTPYPEMQSGESLLVNPITNCDSCTQTDTHLLETNIVKSYEWNEWELRRKAIKLANLRTTVTHSMQTGLSHMRRDNSTQTFPPKDEACQTKRHASTHIPKPLVYLAGLRGSRTGKMIKTNLTTSIDE